MVVDAENVRRSVWPNIAREELVRRLGRHAAREGVPVLVVFDGAAPQVDAPAGVLLAGEPGRSADDLIAELAAEGAVEVAVVVTSDRGLRARLPAGTEVTGGGRFARLLLDAGP